MSMSEILLPIAIIAGSVACIISCIAAIYVTRTRRLSLNKSLETSGMTAPEQHPVTNSSRTVANTQRMMTDDEINSMMLGNLDFNFSCIEARERYRKNLLILSAQNRREELHKRLSNRDIDDDLLQLYANFDSAFLKLYPDFIPNLQNMLAVGEQLAPLPQGTLNSELRVLAMIKLGETDLRHIADVLNISVATVYNYRSKYRNKLSLGQGEDFSEVIRRL